MSDLHTALDTALFSPALRADVRAAVRLSDPDFHAAELARARLDSIHAVYNTPRNDREEAETAARGMANVSKDFAYVVFDGARYFLADEDDLETYHRPALDAQQSTIVFVAEPRAASV